MKSVSEIRTRIYDRFHRSPRIKLPFCGFEGDDDYAAYYTSMYLIQDTEDAMYWHRASGFSKNPSQAYLEYWGLMQAVIIQQDAICELYRSLAQKEIKRMSGAWAELRTLRNMTAGHPSRTSRAQSKTRCFMGRNFGTYDGLQYECYTISPGGTPARKAISYPRINLGQILEQYQVQAAATLYCAYREMRKKW